MEFTTPPPMPPPGTNIIVTFPAERVLHVAINRPDKYNALQSSDSFAMDALWTWYENEPTMRCAILGTTTQKAWCSGGDLKELVSIPVERSGGSMEVVG